MMQDTILSLATAITSPADQELPLLESLCACAEAQIAGRLSDGTAPEDCAEAFTCAAPSTPPQDFSPVGAPAVWSSLPPGR